MTTALLTIAAFVTFVHGSAPKPIDVSGAWTVTITTADGTITGEATLKQTGKSVAGQIGPSGDATIPIAGALKGNKLTMNTSPRPGRTAAFQTCELTVTGQGPGQEMTGTIRGGDAGKGTIKLVRAGH